MASARMGQNGRLAKVVDRRAGPGARSGKPYRQVLRLAHNAWTSDRNLALPSRDASRLRARRIVLRSQASAFGPQGSPVQAQAIAPCAPPLRLARRANCLAFASLGSLRARVGGARARGWARRSGWARRRLGRCGLRSGSIGRRTERNGLRPGHLALRARFFALRSGLRGTSPRPGGSRVGLGGPPSPRPARRVSRGDACQCRRGPGDGPSESPPPGVRTQASTTGARRWARAWKMSRSNWWLELAG